MAELSDAQSPIWPGSRLHWSVLTCLLSVLLLFSLYYSRVLDGEIGIFIPATLFVGISYLGGSLIYIVRLMGALDSNDRSIQLIAALQAIGPPMLLLSFFSGVAFFLQIIEIARLSNSQYNAYLMRILILFGSASGILGATAESIRAVYQEYRTMLPRIATIMLWISLAGFLLFALFLYFGVYGNNFEIN